MAPLLRDRSATQVERVMEREYEQLRRPTVAAVRARLAGQRIRFDDTDLDAFYNQAWHGLYEQLVRGEQVENHAGFLVQAAYRRSIDELRRQHPDRQADDVDPDVTSQEVDLAQTLDDRRRLTGLMEGMRDRLSERECQAAALCYLHGYSRPEAAQALGLAPKRMEKLMDGVSQKIGGLVEEIDSGSWCESRSSLMKAYAFGVLDTEGERYQLARAHLSECSACRRYVRSLRGIGAIVPPVVLPLAALSALGIGGAAAGGAASSGSGSSAGGGGAGAGAGAGAGGGFGGFATGWVVAAVAGVAVAGSVGAFAVINSSGGDGGGNAAAPAAQTTPPAKPASSGGGSGSGSSSSGSGSGSGKSASSQKSSSKGSSPSPGNSGNSGGGNSGGGSGTTTPAATQPATPVTSTPVSTPQSQPTTTTTAPAAPTDDGEQEFGFER